MQNGSMHWTVVGMKYAECGVTWRKAMHLGNKKFRIMHLSDTQLSGVDCNVQIQDIRLILLYILSVRRHLDGSNIRWHEDLVLVCCSSWEVLSEEGINYLWVVTGANTSWDGTFHSTLLDTHVCSHDRLWQHVANFWTPSVPQISYFYRWFNLEVQKEKVIVRRHSV